MSDFMAISIGVLGISVIFLSVLFTYGFRRESVPATTFETKWNLKEKPNRRYVKDVNPGDVIQIEWSRYVTGIGHCKCINNDPETEKILLEFTWNNYKQVGCPEKERKVFNYKDKELENFHLLNPKKVIETPKPQTQEVVTEEVPPQPKSVLKSVYCNYRGHLIVYDVHGKKVQELSGEMTYEKYKEIEKRKDNITEFEGAIEDYKRIAEELKITTDNGKLSA